jgi:Bacterial dnaA protein helix-turn-helix
VKTRCPHCRRPIDSETPVVAAEGIAADIAGRYGWKLSELQGRSRTQDACTLRKLIAAVLRSRGFSYPVIGRALNRHHTTILDGQQRVQRAIEAGFGGALPTVSWNADSTTLNPLQPTSNRKRGGHYRLPGKE